MRSVPAVTKDNDRAAATPVLRRQNLHFCGPRGARKHLLHKRLDIPDKEWGKIPYHQVPGWAIMGYIPHSKCALVA
jgi:hypothetical protein